MRVVFVGASPVAVLAARELSKRGHEVVLIDRDEEKIEQLGEELDCGLIAADGSRPEALEEVGPAKSDFLFCLSDSDETNVLAALVGHSLGFPRVVPKIGDLSLEPICTSLGLQDTIVPDREVAQGLCDLVAGAARPDLHAAVRGGLRFFAFVADEKTAPRVGELELPEQARVIARTRGEQSVLAESDMRIEAGDELVLLVAEELLPELRERLGQDARGDPRERG